MAKREAGMTELCTGYEIICSEWVDPPVARASQAVFLSLLVASRQTAGAREGRW
jgi:hypothetical protein